eukprot:232912-Rhodomonas_salina.2
MEGGVQSSPRKNSGHGLKDQLQDATDQGNSVGNRNGCSCSLSLHGSYLIGETQDHRRDHKALVERTPGGHRAPQLCITHPVACTTSKGRMANHTCTGDYVGGNGVSAAPASFQGR